MNAMTGLESSSPFLLLFRLVCPTDPVAELQRFLELRGMIVHSPFVVPIFTVKFEPDDVIFQVRKDYHVMIDD